MCFAGNPPLFNQQDDEDKATTLPIVYMKDGTAATCSDRYLYCEYTASIYRWI